MVKRIIGNYPSESEALQEINQLLAEGYSKESITLVTNPDTEKSIHSQTDIEILVLSSGSKDDESLGDKIKKFFSLSPQVDDELYSAIPDEAALADYKNAIEKGSTLILVEIKPPSNTAENTYPIDMDTVKDDAAGIYPTAPGLVTEDDPSNRASDENQTFTTRTQHLNYDNEESNTGINTDGDLEIEEDFPPTESPDRTDSY